MSAALLTGAGLFNDASSAVISPCQRYRYWLRREWGPGGRRAVFIMLNPSTADATKNDPTIRRCIGFAKAWGMSELIVVNLFAWRATKPAALLDAPDPVGPDNHAHVLMAAECAAHRDPATGKPSGLVICAWGGNGWIGEQDRAVMGWLDAAGAAPHALRVTADGFPGHPLYIPADARPVPYAGRPR